MTARVVLPAGATREAEIRADERERIVAELLDLADTLPEGTISNNTIKAAANHIKDNQ